MTMMMMTLMTTTTRTTLNDTKDRTRIRITTMMMLAMMMLTMTMDAGRAAGLRTGKKALVRPTSQPTSQIPGVGYTPKAGGAPGPHVGVKTTNRQLTNPPVLQSMPGGKPAIFGFFVSDRNLPLERQQNVGQA